MSGHPVTVEAQWALHGKSPSREQTRVLSCSNGDFRTANFEEAIARFIPAPLGAQPQVSVSYMTPSTASGASYLALAIRRHGDEAGRDGGEQPGYGGDERVADHTSYFCAPYAPLAGEAVTYQAMYRALEPVRLPRKSGPPITVTVTGQGPVPLALDDLAMQAAALLLTGRPVGVLGAQEASTAERLAFIDTVMYLLPYGLRARMAATTWSRATHRDHKFRLFFSDAARAADRPDSFLYWGRPEESAVSRADDWAYEYLEWLRGNVGQPVTKLAQLAAPVPFRRDAILPLLDEIGIVAPDPVPREAVVTSQGYPRPPYLPRRGALRGLNWGELLLRSCAGHVRAGDAVKVRSDTSLLKSLADAADDDKRSRYQQILNETGLLKPGAKLGKSARGLYEQLLRVAFGVPLSYAGYCQLEDCLADPEVKPPHAELLRAISHGGMSDASIKAIVYWHLQGVGSRKLETWYATPEVDCVQLIGLLSRDWARPHHARAVCEVLLDYLAKTRSQVAPREIRGALRQHGFLARALAANRVGHDQYQVSTLSKLLRAAYPDMLDSRDIVQILTGSGMPPTAPLLAAVLLWLESPAADPQLAREAFAYGAVMGLNLSPEVLKSLSAHFPNYSNPRDLP